MVKELKKKTGKKNGKKMDGNWRKTTMTGNSEIVQWIEGLQRFGIKLGLEKTRQALALLGNPEQQFKSVVVAGTNGKGSTAAFLSHMLHANGYKTGLYSSPHLVAWNERIQINNKPVVQKQFEKNAVELREKLQSAGMELTQFEFLTVLALDFFAEQKTAWAVLEVGLGGRLDAVNAVNAQASCITNIALDHQQYLGNSRREIAFEKAGVIKKNRPVLTAETDPQLVELFRDLAAGQQAPFFAEKKDFSAELKEMNLEKTIFDFRGFGVDWKNLQIALIGKYQVHNAGLALATLCALKQQENLRLAENKTRKALEKTRWPGRFDIVSKEPFILLDCCHNPAGVQAFAQTLQAVLPRLKAKMILGNSETRKPADMLQPLAPFASEMVLTQATFKGIPVEELQQAAVELLPSYKIKTVPNVQKAVEETFSNLQPGDAVVLAGSIYMLGEALQAPALKKRWKKKQSE